MGFEGTSVTPQIRKLIQEHHIGSLLLTAKNLKSRQPYPFSYVIWTMSADLQQTLSRVLHLCSSFRSSHMMLVILSH